MTPAAPDTKPHVLSAEGVSFAYSKEQPVFSAISASIRGGEVVGVVGPNGSGKSTFLRVLAGLLRPQAGRVLFEGRPLPSLSGMERARKLGFLPQSVSPVFAMTVFEAVCLGRYPHVGPFAGLGPGDVAVVERCLRDTNTEGLRHRDFLALSGGERQRVLLASILAQEPRILLLDEPTSALDIHHQFEVFSLLRRLSREGYGVAVVTHDLNLAARFCDSLLLLRAGAGLVAAGAPEAVLTEALLSDAYASPIRVAIHPLSHTPLVCADIHEEAP
jgi:iron complex transport system ATP-binding protein